MTPPDRSDGGREAGGKGRTVTEWTTLAVSALVLLLVIGAVVLELRGEREPATPVATVVGEPERRADRWFVEVEVVNRGDETAAEVQVTASLAVEGEVAEADQVVDFLAGGATEHLTFAFDRDPAEGELSVQVAGFADP